MTGRETCVDLILKCTYRMLVFGSVIDIRGEKLCNLKKPKIFISGK
jgi:hypothetical protein